MSDDMMYPMCFDFMEGLQLVWLLSIECPISLLPSYTRLSPPEHDLLFWVYPFFKDYDISHTINDAEKDGV